MALAATLVDAKNRQCQAPEVASLKPGGPPVDSRADVYAFGSLAHVVATGLPPRNGAFDAALPGRLASLLREALASDVYTYRSVARAIPMLPPDADETAGQDDLRRKIDELQKQLAELSAQVAGS